MTDSEKEFARLYEDYHEYKYDKKHALFSSMIWDYQQNKIIVLKVEVDKLKRELERR